MRYRSGPHAVCPDTWIALLIWWANDIPQRRRSTRSGPQAVNALAPRPDPETILRKPWAAGLDTRIFYPALTDKKERLETAGPSGPWSNAQAAINRLPKALKRSRS